MENFVGEIRMMGFGIVPKGWLACAGQMLPISGYQPLFALLGTTYGGNGQTTFALPDLRGRVALGVGQSASSGNNYAQGQVGGQEGVTLQTNQLPAHNHAFTGTVKVADGRAISPSPANGQYPAAGTATQYSTGTPNATLGNSSLNGATGNAGGNQPHENRQPVMAMNYCIATTGTFPSRN
jgi:microcystin-dependent protein